jgi:hypothetical protein
MSRPKRSYLHKVIRLKWRDSFENNGLTSLKDLGDDCIWESFGAVIRESDLFITIAFQRELTDPMEYGDVLSVPWTQVISATVLDTLEALSAPRKLKIHPQDVASQDQPQAPALARLMDPLLPERESA